MSTKRPSVGLLLGAEEDWPQAFEAIAQRLGVFGYAGRPITSWTPSGCTSRRSTCGTRPGTRW